MNQRSSCIIREAPLPEREYRVSPPERWERGWEVRPARSRSRRRRRWGNRVLPLLLALVMVFSFMLGRASAAGHRARIRLLSPRATQQQKLEQAETVGKAEQTEQAEAPLPAQTSSEEPPVELKPDTSEPVEETPVAAEEKKEEAWNLVLINGDHALPKDYQAPPLTQMANGHAIDSRVYPALQEMMDAARAAGVHPTICSSFRTWATQERLYWNKVARLKNAGWDKETVEQEAARWVARPGTSEHQAGLAVDIVDRSYQVLDHKQENTAAQKWLMAHCAEYGFILRYPSDKGEITGVGYEPWHYRYVGKEAAQAIMTRGVCLEEYLAEGAETGQ